MVIKKIKKNKGFVLLYAVMLSSILLAITVGVTNISLKEIQFGTSAKDTNDAFYSADIGAECALYYDKTDPANNAFTGTQTQMNCAGSNITLNILSSLSWNFVIPKLSSGGQGCAIVTVDKSDSRSCASSTCVTSKGYNNGSDISSPPDWACNPSSNAVERQLELSY